MYIHKVNRLTIKLTNKYFLQPTVNKYHRDSTCQKDKSNKTLSCCRESTMHPGSRLTVFIITSDKPQMKLHVQCINDKVCRAYSKEKKLLLAFTYVTESV